MFIFRCQDINLRCISHREVRVPACLPPCDLVGLNRTNCKYSARHVVSLFFKVYVPIRLGSSSALLATLQKSVRSQLLTVRVGMTVNLIVSSSLLLSS
jgi:hypothetical protein